jgi:lipopolysaccharide/colanic/teichoic acid biosynthesis glycosyltransferase
MTVVEPVRPVVPWQSIDPESHIATTLRDGLRVGAQNSRSLELRVKRCIDLAIAAMMLAVVAPLLGILILILLIDTPGPVFYRRRVLGLGGPSFDALKLRTMVCDGDALLAARPDLRARLDAYHKLDDDPRITRTGRWLRRLSLDELPQLWNVLRGDMSLVGPRMISPPELERYGPHGATLLTVKPGLTGLWQVSGRSNLPPSERVRLDLAYVHQRCLALDLKLLLRTIPTVLCGRGAR